MEDNEKREAKSMVPNELNNTFVHKHEINQQEESSQKLFQKVKTENLGFKLKSGLSAFSKPAESYLKSDHTSSTKKCTPEIKSKALNMCGASFSSKPFKWIQKKTSAAIDETDNRDLDKRLKKLAWSTKLNLNLNCRAPNKGTPSFIKLLFFAFKVGIVTGLCVESANGGLWGAYEDTQLFYTNVLNFFIPKENKKSNRIEQIEKSEA